MANKKNRGFSETFKVHLDDTSAYGSAHYMSYHRWIAHTKEDFFLKRVKGFPAFFGQKGIRLVVITSSLHILGETKLHGTVTVRMQCAELKRVKAKLVFTCFGAKDQKLAASESDIIFMNSENRVIGIPDAVRNALRKIIC